MKVYELIRQLKKGDLGKELIMFSDEEGNSLSRDIRIEKGEDGSIVLVPYSQESFF